MRLVVVMFVVAVTFGVGCDNASPDSADRTTTSQWYEEPAPTRTSIDADDVWLIQDQPPCPPNAGCEVGVYIGPAYYSIACDATAPEEPEKGQLFGVGDAAATEARSLQRVGATKALALRLAADTCPQRPDRWVQASGLLIDG